VTDATRKIKAVLWALFFLGLVAIGFRLRYGLGAVSNLSDAVPWGLWKILNMVAGVALATSGFTVGFLVYVLRQERFRPLVKPALLIAVLGYASSVFVLTLDIGLPHRIWHPIVMWNEHSFLFEVAWCVMLYLNVALIEFSPVVLERLRLGRLVNLLHRVAFGLIVAGIALSSLHHSSLGALFLVTPQRLHPLWYTPRLPLFFILSAVGTGLMVVILVKILYARWYDPEPVFGVRACRAGSAAPPAGANGPADGGGGELPMLRGLAVLAAGILGLYGILKVADLLVTGAWTHLLAGTWEGALYAGELLLTGILPPLLILLPAVRRSPGGLGVTAALAASGLVWNRLNVGLFGYYRDAGEVYLPSLAEWALSLGVIAGAGLVFFFLVEHTNVFGSPRGRKPRTAFHHRAAAGRPTGFWDAAVPGGLRSVSLIAVFVVPLAWVLIRPAGPGGALSVPRPVTPPTALDPERETLLIDGNRNGLAVRFPHRDHQSRLGEEASCAGCHHLAAPRDHSTPCSRCHRDMERPTALFNHTFHFQAVAAQRRTGGILAGNDSCIGCHAEGETKTAAGATDCMECHDEMIPTRERPAVPPALSRACGYREAMHRTCVACHRTSRETADRPDLAECATCHPPGGDPQKRVAVRTGR
jgi:Ni/Fe-hydrogenase subunit HybB-like protein